MGNDTHANGRAAQLNVQMNTTLKLDLTFSSHLSPRPPLVWQPACQKVMNHVSSQFQDTVKSECVSLPSHYEISCSDWSTIYCTGRRRFLLADQSTYFLSDLETGQTSHITEPLLRLKTWQTGLDESSVSETNLVE